MPLQFNHTHVDNGIRAQAYIVVKSYQVFSDHTILTVEYWTNKATFDGGAHIPYFTRQLRVEGGQHTANFGVAALKAVNKHPKDQAEKWMKNNSGEFPGASQVDPE